MEPTLEQSIATLTTALTSFTQVFSVLQSISEQVSTTTTKTANVIEDQQVLATQQLGESKPAPEAAQPENSTADTLASAGAASKESKPEPKAAKSETSTLDNSDPTVVGSKKAKPETTTRTYPNRNCRKCIRDWGFFKHDPIHYSRCIFPFDLWAAEVVKRKIRDGDTDSMCSTCAVWGMGNGKLRDLGHDPAMHKS